MNVVLKKYDAEDILEESTIVIEKLGGDQTPKFRDQAERIESNHRTGKKQIIVLSALKSETFRTTDQCIVFAEQLKKGDIVGAQATLRNLRSFHEKIIPAEIEEAHQKVMLNALNEPFQELEALLNTTPEIYTDEEDRYYIDSTGKEHSLTGFGEQLIERLYQTYLRARGTEVTDLIEEENSCPDVNTLRESYQRRIKSTLETGKLAITGGYDRHLAKKRNYSELKMIELAIAAEKNGSQATAHVVKEVPILSADPRLLKNKEDAQLIGQLSQRRAGELFGVRGAQAGAIHSDVMARLRDEGSKVPIVVSNPRNKSLGSTVIHPDAEDLENHPIVASKIAPSTLWIEGPMSADSGVLHQIAGELLENVVDQIFSTNNGLVITLNKKVDEATRKRIEERLQAQHPSYQVRNESDNTVVITLGAEKITGKQDALDAAGIHVAFSNESREAGYACFIIPEGQAKEAVNALHAVLYEHLPKDVQPAKPWFITKEQAFELHNKFGGPIYIYSEARLIEAAQAVLEFQHAYGFTARYAMKANPHKRFLQLFDQMGIKIDASSGNEAWRAMKAGISPQKILLTSQELPEDFDELVKQGVEFNACSLTQLERYGEAFPGSEVSLRFNPGVGSGGNARTNVGDEGSSFGIWHEDMPQVKAILERHGLKVKRVHTHIGSGTDPEVWTGVAELSIKLMDHFSEAKILNLGGGFKVARTQEEKTTDLQDVSSHIKQIFEVYKARTGREIHLEIEPGTYLMADAGIILTDVMEVHQTTQGHDTIKARTGMSEIIRPTLYGSEHPIWVFQKDTNDKKVGYYVVGRHCESGDQLSTAKGKGEQARRRWLPKANPRDIIVIGGTGAYCNSMSTKGYNSFPSAAEVLIQEGGNTIVISREGTLDDLTSHEL